MRESNGYVSFRFQLRRRFVPPRICWGSAADTYGSERTRLLGLQRVDKVIQGTMGGPAWQFRGVAPRLGGGAGRLRAAHLASPLARGGRWRDLGLGRRRVGDDGCRLQGEVPRAEPAAPATRRSGRRALSHPFTGTVPIFAAKLAKMGLSPLAGRRDIARETSISYFASTAYASVYDRLVDFSRASCMGRPPGAASNQPGYLHLGRE